MIKKILNTSESDPINSDVKWWIKYSNISFNFLLIIFFVKMPIRLNLMRFFWDKLVLIIKICYLDFKKSKTN